MKLQVIVNAHRSGLIDILGAIGIVDMERRHKLRMGMKKLSAELTVAYAEQDRIIDSASPEKHSVSPNDTNYAEVVGQITAYFDTEAESNVDPCITQEDLNGAKISVFQEDLIEALGLMIKSKGHDNESALE